MRTHESDQKTGGVLKRKNLLSNPQITVFFCSCELAIWVTVLTFSQKEPSVVPTPLEGGGTIHSNGFFCLHNFGRSIYSS